MQKILEGKSLAKKILNEIKEEASVFRKKIQRFPALAIIQIGDNQASNIYIEQKKIRAREINFCVEHIKLPENIDLEESKDIINALNFDETIDGIIMQLPIPERLQELCNYIDPEKDIDGIGKIQQANLLFNASGLRPCTPSAVLSLLEYYEIPIEGSDICVIGRSILVGQSLALMLLQKNASVSILHSKTKNLESYTKKADIICIAAGKPGLVNGGMIKNGAVIVDIGINRGAHGIIGDFEPTQNCIYSPVPGGVGPLTVACLMLNTLRAAKNHHFKKEDYLSSSSLK